QPPTKQLMAASESRENDSREEYPQERADAPASPARELCLPASIPATTLAGARKKAWVKRISVFLKEPPPTSQCVRMRCCGTCERGVVSFGASVRSRKSSFPRHGRTGPASLRRIRPRITPFESMMVVRLRTNRRNPECDITSKH